MSYILRLSLLCAALLVLGPAAQALPLVPDSRLNHVRAPRSTPLIDFVDLNDNPTPVLRSLETMAADAAAASPSASAAPTKPSEPVWPKLLVVLIILPIIIVVVNMPHILARRKARRQAMAGGLPAVSSTGKVVEDTGGLVGRVKSVFGGRRKEGEERGRDDVPMGKLDELEEEDRSETSSYRK